MARVLIQKFNVPAEPLHDRPVETFQPLSQKEKDEFLSRLSETAPFSAGLRKRNHRLLVSSTSWTADEDFSLLLDALVKYSDAAAKERGLPKLLVIITGKGPMKNHYIEKIRSLKEGECLHNVTIRTVWLSIGDYASLLGAADLGISLHTSSSGVDLPMKVVDMFGAGLPIVGWCDFQAWGELVKEGFNGRGFKSSEELRDLLIELFQDNNRTLDSLREGAIKECSNRWDDEWDLVAGKLFKIAK